MTDTMQGKIISTQLGEFSEKQIIYGYIGIELSDKTHVKVKIDSFTWYESLAVGDEVVLETHTLANTDILVARTIRLKSSLDMESEDPNEAQVSA